MCNNVDVLKPRLILGRLVSTVVIAGGATPTSSAALAPTGATHHVQSLRARVDPGPEGDRSGARKTISHPGAPGYSIIPASEFRRTSPDSDSAQRVFRGGRRSTPPSSSAIQTPPRSSLVASSSRIAISPGVVNWGMAYGGLPITPPDSTGAIGPLHYVEMVNSRIAVYDRNLNVVTAQTEFWTFVGNSASVPYCDPQIQWAPSANRWLFSFLYCGNDPANQGFILGWSKTSDPTTLSPTGWCRFASITGALLFDYMKLGHNSNYMILGGNYYSNPTTANPSFSSAAIKWVTLPS